MTRNPTGDSNLANYIQKIKKSMLKRINIKSILQAKDSLNDVAFKEFLKNFGIEIRDAEIEDLRCLSIAMTDAGCGIGDFDRYFVGYKIPQIGKEFDLLRLGGSFLVNIELKSDCTEEKIEKQLVRNKYYLSFLGLMVYSFTFVSASKELYFLQDNGQLNKVQIDLLRKLLSTQELDGREDLDALFNPSDYLVSPFNSTKKFLAGEYDTDWKGNYSVRCLTGEAQLSIIYRRLYKLYNDEKYERVADKLLLQISTKQNRFPYLKNMIGGFIASAPFYGKYMRFMMNNWTCKFDIDALLLSINPNMDLFG